MSLAFERSAYLERAVVVLRGGVIAREVCRRGARGEVAAIFERSLYLRVGAEFICIGEPAIGNGPTTLIIAARVAQLGLRRGERAFISNDRITMGDVLFDLSNCQSWRAPPWPTVPSSAKLRTTCVMIAQRAAVESPADSLARAAFGPDDTPLARLARPRVARFASWLPPTPDPSPSRFAWGEGNPAACAADLVGLGYGLTPSGDDFLIGALAALDALGQTNTHAALGRAVVAAADSTSPLSASFLRAAAAGHAGENLHTMVAAILTGDAGAALAQARRIGHTSGWDTLAGAVVACSRVLRRLKVGALRGPSAADAPYRC